VYSCSNRVSGLLIDVRQSVAGSAQQDFVKQQIKQQQHSGTWSNPTHGHSPAEQEAGNASLVCSTSSIQARRRHLAQAVPKFAYLYVRNRQMLINKAFLTAQNHAVCAAAAPLQVLQAMPAPCRRLVIFKAGGYVYRWVTIHTGLMFVACCVRNNYCAPSFRLQKASCNCSCKSTLAHPHALPHPACLHLSTPPSKSDVLTTTFFLPAVTWKPS
jgi:hypothetical protein